jgi:methylthioribulose-1-phosphate dehydratase
MNTIGELIEDTDLAQLCKLSRVARALNAAGHAPATSGNYSLRSKTQPGAVLISESGIDKSRFTEENFLTVDMETGLPGPCYPPKKPSAETAIHLAIYRATSAGCVLHSHLLEALLFADLYPAQAAIQVSGLELLKGFAGITTHRALITIPCFENTQDIEPFARALPPHLRGEDPIFGFILRDHGLYTWGAGVDDAKRHLEVFEYLFRYSLARRGRYQ